MKAVSWKLTSTGLAMGIAFWLTGSFDIAVMIAIFHIPSSILLFMIHEYIWG
jgi:uncharacterized membrane protein